MRTPQTECTVRRFIIAPFQIHYLRFLIEAYEGIAVVSTEDPDLGLVRLNIAPGCEEDVERILEGEKLSLMLREIEPRE
ncbi:MAG: DUF4911 domain-containing protein [Deltaproteobacteria bacterium]|nr:DUF4911 domain-containing protein [Deltaproteobacteria bacterium]